MTARRTIAEVVILAPWWRGMSSLLKNWPLAQPVILSAAKNLAAC